MSIRRLGFSVLPLAACLLAGCSGESGSSSSGSSAGGGGGGSNVDLYDDGESFRSFSPTTVSQGNTVTIDCDIRNGGSAPAGAFIVRFYASSNTTITSSDHYLGFDSINGIAAGAFANASRTATLSTSIPTGTYWIGWIIDATSVVAESNESNNVAYKTGYQLTVTTSGPDLYDDGESFRSFSPTAASAGGSISVSCDIRNGGSSNSGSFTVSFYASANTTISAGDYYLGAVSMGSISAGNFAGCNLSSGSLPTTIPNGNYWVGWIIDSGSAVSESDESNNIAYKTGYQLTVGAVPDLYDDGQAFAGFSPSTVTRGNSMNAWSDTRNGGTASSGSFQVHYYLSTNTTITTADTYLGSVSMSSIAAGTWADCDLNGATVPTSMSTGTYYVGWIIDATGAVTEGNEGNNTEYKQSGTLTVQ